MDLFAAAARCLAATTVEAKIQLSHETAAAFADGQLTLGARDGVIDPIGMPGRPSRPLLVEPRHLPKRGLGTDEGRAAFIHSIAHIEFNAIDLAWDAVYRFREMPAEYYVDWVRCADDEARHFTMLQQRLAAFGHAYGDFDAHNGLWEMAMKTADDVLVRMALVPRVLEARGLDVTPAMITKLRSLQDDATADILEVILREEVAHVAAGSRWFRYACNQRGVEPRATFEQLLRDYARSALFGPFNLEARAQAGFDEQELAALKALI